MFIYTLRQIPPNCTRQEKESNYFFCIAARNATHDICNNLHVLHAVEYIDSLCYRFSIKFGNIKMFATHATVNVDKVFLHEHKNIPTFNSFFMKAFSIFNYLCLL